MDSRKSQIGLQQYFFPRNDSIQLWSDSPQLWYSAVGSITQEEHRSAGVYPELGEETEEETGSQQLKDLWLVRIEK